ncbi:MAG: PKD domain-containing protein [Candidatus Wallbacteria bacterium]|nr:PKD domain-containing protein [Candidatus Wallbacteria bacterium]
MVRKVTQSIPAKFLAVLSLVAWLALPPAALAGGDHAHAAGEPCHHDSRENHAPAITAWGPATANAGSTVTLSSCPFDPDGDSLTLVWKVTDAATGRVLGCIGTGPSVRWHARYAGSFVFSVTARDPGGLEARAETSLGVNAVPRVAITGPRGGAPGSTVTLQAAGSDADGDAVTYAWALVGGTGPAFPVGDATGSSFAFTLPAAGSYVLAVIARDGRGGAASAQYTVIGNTPPSAAAGPDQVVLAKRPAVLPGCAYDADGDRLSVLWSRHPTDPGDGPAVTIRSPRCPTAQFTPPVPGTYNFEFLVTDMHGATAAATARITAIAAENRPPVVTVTPPACATAGEWLPLRASASDPDRDPVSYRWTVPAGVTVRNPRSATPLVLAANAGTYSIEVVAEDGQGGSARAGLEATFGPKLQVAISGPSETFCHTPIQLASELTGDTGSGVEYRWCRVGGSQAAVSMDGVESPALWFKASQPGTYVVELKVTNAACGKGTARFSIRVLDTSVKARASLGVTAAVPMTVTSFTLTNSSMVETLTSTSPSPVASFVVTVTEGRTVRLLDLDAQLTLVNKGTTGMPVTAVAMVVRYRSTECGWLEAGPAILGDAGALRSHLPPNPQGSLQMFDTAGNPIPGEGLPALAAGSTSTFRLRGRFDMTCLGLDARTPVTVKVWTVFPEDSRRCTCGSEQHRHGMRSVYAIQHCVHLCNPVRVNEKVTLTDSLTHLPDAAFVGPLTLAVKGRTADGVEVTGTIGADSMFQQTLCATGRAGARSVFTAAGPVAFVAGRCGSTAAATTASLAGTVSSEAAAQNLHGSPASSSIGLMALDCQPAPVAAGDFVTYTQGGWGTVPRGQNPGTIREAGFPTVFPAGLAMGGIHQVILTSSQTVERFLPQGGPPSAFTTSAIDPQSTAAGVLGGQLAAASLNVAYSAAGRLAQRDPSPLGALMVATGPFAGTTVSALVAMANRAVGGDPAALPAGTTLSDLNDALTRVNECFDNGAISTGFLRRP